mmetsp:Transcript_36864/g.94261  ORF Transcript_36864/g.94261 Transcript_36864/m.94261 type:complete len:312 (-) Transcript_36864:429-1364(-)|eukprot:jgi/Tetstr1/436563/TSEL_002717.t1
MGSSKHKKKRRHSDSEDSDSSGDDSGSSSDHGERSQHKKHRSKDRKKGKKHKSDSKEKRKLREAKKFLKQHLKEQAGSSKKDKPVKMVPVAADFPIKPISSEDYFLKNHEFSKWLKEQKGLTFNEMSSEETHALFGEFTGAWNGRTLSEEYYSGQLGSVARTSYNWGLGGAAERAEAEREERFATQHAAQHSRKQWKAEQKDLLDELLPKATGREAMLEKKAARREDARQRDTSPEMNRLIGGGDIMGGDDSFQAAKMREQRRQQFRTSRQSAKAEETNARAAAARANEDARMEAFRALAQRGPISIPKRG